MPLTLPQKPKTLAQELKEKAQNDTAVRETAAIPTQTKAQPLNTSAQTGNAPEASSPRLSQDLAKVYQISEGNKKLGGALFRGIASSTRDALSPYYSPYLQPTNSVVIRELNNLGVDTSKIDKEFFERNAWLKQYARAGMNGVPLEPNADSSREEKAGYYYVRLLNAENQTVRAEKELAGLNRELSYWAGRKDRNYSDEEIVDRIDWKKYPTLSLMREGKTRGRPVPLNRSVDFNDDALYGMLWSARNLKGSGSHTLDAMKHALGMGNTFKADPEIKAKLDPQSNAYNPYALGSTVDEAAEYFGVGTFNQEWFNKNKGILTSKNETAKRMYQKAFDAEQFTIQAEAELQALDRKIAIRLKLSAASGKADPDVILRNILKDSPSLIRMDEGLLSGDLARLTRPVDYRYEDIAAMVKEKADIQNRRMSAVKNSDNLAAAAQNEKRAVIAAQGNALQTGIFAKSLTASKSILWEEGPAIAWNINTWYRHDGDDKLSGLRLSSGGGGKPQPHPYAGHMTEWSALKADAAELNLLNSYGVPMEEYYALKGKPDWMVQADEADLERTIAENPPMTSPVPQQSVFDQVAQDKAEAMSNRRYDQEYAYGQESENAYKSVMQQANEQTEKDVQAAYNTPEQQSLQQQYLDKEAEYKAAEADPKTSAYALRQLAQELDALQEQISAAAVSSDADRINVNNITYKSGIKSYREAERLGINQTAAQKIIRDLRMQEEDQNYKSPIFRTFSEVGMYGKPDDMTDGEWARILVQKQIDYYQKKYDKAKKYYDYFVGPKGYLKKEFSEDSYGEWLNDYLTAEYKLQDAKNQMELLSDDLDSMIAIGEASPDNRISEKKQNDVILTGNGAYYRDPNTYRNAILLYPSEKMLYLYKLGKYGIEEANTYLDSINESVKVRFGKSVLQTMNEQPLWVQGADRVITAPVAGALAFWNSIYNAAANKDTTAYDTFYLPQMVNEQSTANILETLPKDKKGLGELGFSGIDMLTSLLFGSPAGMAAIQAMEAAGGKAVEVERWGADSYQTFANTASTFAIEYLIERFGTGERLANILANPDTAKGFLKTIFLKGTLPEMIEEGLTQYVENGSDKLYNGPNSRYNQLIAQYSRSGLGPEAAVAMADIQTAWEYVEATAGGALFGTVGGGIVNVIGNINADTSARLLQKQYPNMPADVAKSIGQMMATGEKASQESINSFTAVVKEASASTMVPPSTSEVQEDTERDMLPESGQTTDSDTSSENGSIQPPLLTDIEHIEQLESNKDYAGAAGLRYNALINSLKSSLGAGVSVLATDEGAVSMAAQMMKDVAIAQLSGTAIDPEARTMYEQAAQEVLGIKMDAIAQFASFLNGAVNTTGSVSMGTDLTGALSTIVSMKDTALKQVLDTYVSDGNLDLSSAQTLYTLMKLREAVQGTTSDADVIIQDTLVQLTSDALKSADVSTGNPALDDALMAAASSSNNLHAIQELFGMDGVNYAANLIQSGHVKEAVLLATLPSYAKAVIVAQENMKNVALNQDAILAQENAIAQDMQDPFIVKYAQRQAKGQALYAFGMDLTGNGAMGDMSGYKTEVANAQAGWNESKAALHRAIQNEQKASNTLAQAQAKFYEDMSNSDAADSVVAAHQSLMEASTAREDAEKALKSSQQALTSAQQNLNGAQQMARASVNAKAQQSYDEFLRQRAETRANEQVGGQAGEPGTVLSEQTLTENVSNERKEGNPLAPGNERDIMGEGTQGENASGAGDAGKADGQTAVIEDDADFENVLTLSTRFLNKMDPMWKNSKNIEPIEGYQDIVCHGDKTGFSYKDLDGNEINLTPREFAEILKNSSVFEGRPVRLISCQAGAVDSFTAQYIANQLGVSVLAPTDIVYVYPDGEMKVGKYNTGSWALFGPKER